MREGRAVEFKERVTPGFLKTVSAFANFGAGDIYFGIADDGSLVGVESPDQVCLDVENAINDALDPRPRFMLEVVQMEKRPVVRLQVFEGADKPYLCRGRAYRRSHTATVVVDRDELNRLVLEGRNLSFEEAPSVDQNLTFGLLGELLKERLAVDSIDSDLLKTLNLYSEESGYNNAAAVLSDVNSFPGIDIVKFGASDDEIADRIRLEGISALRQFCEALEVFRRYYQVEQIEGALRQTRELVPEEAFREAVANALVHRLWDSGSFVRVMMRDDGIEVTSPGGLPPQLSEEEYLEGRISNLRNPIIGNVFFRLGFIEMFATGVRRIRAAYEGLGVSPSFSVMDNSISVVLPTLSGAAPLTAEEERLLGLLPHNRLLSRGEIEVIWNLSRGKTIRLINALISKNRLALNGSGRAIKYYRV